MNCVKLLSSNDNAEPTRIDPLRDRPEWMGSSAAAEYLTSQSTGVETICEICQDAGWLKEAVPFGHPHFGVLFPCQCKQTQWAHRKAQELAQLSNLAAVRDKTFTTFNPFIPGLRDVIPRIRSYAKHPAGWLALLGAYGIGKTHLAAAVANDALDRGEHVLFTIVPDLLDHLRATYGPQSTVAYDEQFELVRTVPLLILDDLGTESATPWAREKLYQIINHRYNTHLATVITSNLKPEAIEPRIYSRMCDPAIGVVIPIAAQDYRRRSNT